MSLASTRERRSTAGNRYSKILNEAEEDDFFKTTYGGFNEEDNDNDYKEEKEVEDVTDSDISIDENDEVVSGNEDDEPKRTRKAGLFTKAYKEPKPVPAKATAQTKESPMKKISPALARKMRNDRLERKSIRRTTAAKSAATRELVKSRIEIEKKRKMKRTPRQEMKLSQEQLLEEAKITEEENLKSLEKFQKLELEKKKVRFVRKAPTGPMVRYHSMAMPLIQVMERGNGEKETVATKCERSFVTFEDTDLFHKIFKKKKPKVGVLYCPVTRLKAKYLDPVTGVPYARKQVFRAIRDTYNTLLEATGDRNDPQVAAWLDHLNEVRMEQAVAAALEQDNIFD